MSGTGPIIIEVPDTPPMLRRDGDAVARVDRFDEEDSLESASQESAPPSPPAG